MTTYKPSTWDLREVQPKNMDEELKLLDSKVSLLENKRNTLNEKITSLEFLTWVKQLEEIKIISSKIGAFVSLKFSENSADQKAVAQMSKVENALTKLGNRLIFFSLWFKDLPEKKAEELIKVSGPNSYHFQELRKTKPYTLKENEEKIISLKDLGGASALNNVYNIFTSQFRYHYKNKELTQEEVISLVRSPSPQVRKDAYLLFLKKYADNKDVIGEIYKNLLNDWREESIGLRGYKSPINVRNVANDIPDEAVEVLLKVCQKNQNLFHRFFELKRKKLKLKKMQRFDLYAPIQKKQKKFSYDEAVKLVLQTFGDFSPQFKDNAEKIISQNHIHSQLQKNKQSGAYCYGVNTSLAPYVLLNYTKNLRDVSTLAHELGHGIHYLLASKHTEFTVHACLPLAETASILSEMILTERLREKYPEIAEELLFYKLDDLYASIIRQAGFVMFEKKAHQMMEEGKTIEEMSQVYYSMLKEQLGSKINIDKAFAYEWAYIPHIFHAPFYCYAYVFGNLLTLALFELYRERGPSFADKIIELLSKGGSESPKDIVSAIGLDITKEELWEKGFVVIREMIEKLENKS
ncbi:M3 family oligoendopeptidase [Candidatus Woesearchaeota archaeon]|nr:M3 family oligoendopeptidase [Candidatus Woesearchaeota archaeon]